jgi:hypothetical protein
LWAVGATLIALIPAGVLVVSQLREGQATAARAAGRDQRANERKRSVDSGGVTFANASADAVAAEQFR